MERNIVMFGALVWDGNAGHVRLYNKFDIAPTDIRVDALIHWIQALEAAYFAANEELLQEQGANSESDASEGFDITRAMMAIDALEQLGFSWEDGQWVSAKPEYRKIMAIMQGAGDQVSTKTALDTYQGKKL